MLHLVEQLAPWLGPGRQSFAVATVVAASGSVPRPVGTAMAVRADGAVLGSLSGGCVEGAVHAAALDAIAAGECHRETFGYSDADAFAVGLSCGGVLEVHVQPVLQDRRDGADSHLDPGARALAALAADLGSTDAGSDAGTARAALVRRLDTSRRTATLVTEPLSATELPARALRDLVPRGAREAAAAQVAEVLRAGGTATVRVAPGVADGACDDEPITLLVETRTPPPRFLVVGANDFAGALVRAVRLLGYRVTLVDPREVFADARRFPEADEVVVDWPDRYLAEQVAAGAVDARTGVAVLSHDAKIDVPFLLRALDLPLAYVGAMGSRRSHEQRVRSLRERGVGDDALARLRSPIGLDLGAVTPEEVAVSVVAELVAVRHGRAVPAPLSSTDGPLHGAGPPGGPTAAPTQVPTKEQSRWT